MSEPPHATTHALLPPASADLIRRVRESLAWTGKSWADRAGQLLELFFFDFDFDFEEPLGCSALRHDGLSCFRLTFRHWTMRSASGTNSLHSRITSGVQRSAASDDCAAAGVGPATSNSARVPAAADSSAPDKFNFACFMIDASP